MAAPSVTVGILSIGEMGLGYAKLLTANNYRVVTNIAGRRHADFLSFLGLNSSGQSASVHLVSSDEELAATSDYILSIVPPRDALSTAQRILKGSTSPSFRERTKPLYFLDLNAVSPRSAREIAELFHSEAGIRFVDGAIIGGPPKPKDPSGPSDSEGVWQRPSVPTSGAFPVSEGETGGAQLASLLKIQHISQDVGAASGLKMCFGALTKGFTALAIQSFTTAHKLNVLPELQDHLQRHMPNTLEAANRGLVGMPPKAYRWVKEMEEIGETFAEDGGFDAQENVFKGVSETYELVAHGTDLGKETTEQRTRGKTAEDVARVMSEGIERRKVKTE